MSSDFKSPSNDKKDGRVHDSRRDPLEQAYKPFRDSATHKDTNRDDPHSLRCRVFIGNLQMSRKELEDVFCQYGKVVGCSVHNNYGFVQFDNEKAADMAVAKENGNVYYGKRVDVNLAGDRRRDKMGDRERERDSRPPFPPNRREREFDRDAGRPYRKSPPRDRPRMEDYDRFPSRFEDPYGRRGRSPSPPRRMDDRPYGRHDDYFGRDSYRGEPYPRDPYPRHSFDRRGESFDRDRRDPYDSPRGPLAERGGGDRYDSHGRDYPRPDDYPGPTKRPKMDYDMSSSLDDMYSSSKNIEAPTDCVIVVMNKQQRGYAEMVERRLKSVGLVIELHFHGTQPITELLDDVARRGVLYAVVITSQHEVHRSVTVNILHGTPQEHRNMPLDDAMRLVGQNFDRYMQDLRERARLSSSNSTSLQESSKPAVSAPKEESSDVAGLLRKAATGDDLSAEQLTLLIDSLSKRQEELLGSTGATNGKGAGNTASHSSQPAVDPQSIAKQQADLQAKILSILNPGGVTKTSGTLSIANLTSPQPSSQKPASVTPPSVQKATAPATLSTTSKPIFPLYPSPKPSAATSGGVYLPSSSGATSSRVISGGTPPKSTSPLTTSPSSKPFSSASLNNLSVSTSQTPVVAGSQSQSFQFAKPIPPTNQGMARAPTTNPVRTRMTSPTSGPRPISTVGASQMRSPVPGIARGRGHVTPGTGTSPRGVAPTRGVTPSISTPGGQMAPRAPTPVSSTATLVTSRAPTPGGLLGSRGRVVAAPGRGTSATAAPGSSSFATTRPLQSQMTQKPSGGPTPVGTGNNASRGTISSRGSISSRGTISSRGAVYSRGAVSSRGALRGVPETRGGQLVRGGVHGGPASRAASATRGAPPTRGLVRGGARGNSLLQSSLSSRGGPMTRGTPFSRGTPRGRVLVRGGPSFRGGPGRGVPGNKQGYGY